MVTSSRFSMKSMASRARLAPYTALSGALAVPGRTLVAVAEA